MERPVGDPVVHVANGSKLGHKVTIRDTAMDQNPGTHQYRGAMDAHILLHNYIKLVY